MRVRPLVDCIMSEIEPFFLFSDLGVNINSINQYLSVLPVILLYQSPYDHYMFSIFSGLDYSESFHIRHLYTQVICFKCLSFIISGCSFMYIC